jgi:hypothetical protein
MSNAVFISIWKVIKAFLKKETLKRMKIHQFFVGNELKKKK